MRKIWKVELAKWEWEDIKKRVINYIQQKNQISSAHLSPRSFQNTYLSSISVEVFHPNEYQVN